jgi:hypothetical protein
MLCRLSPFAVLPLVALIAGTSSSSKADLPAVDLAQASLPVHVVVPVMRRNEEAERLTQAALEIDRVLMERAVRHIPYDDTSNSFAQRYAAPPPPVTPGDLVELIEQSKAAQRAAAVQQFDEAISLMQQIRRRFDAKLESINRDDEGARAYLRACVSEVRALASTTDEGEAKKAVRRCVVAVPDLEPIPKETPPSVLRLWKAAVSEMPFASVMVEAAGGRGDCTVLLRGRPQGTAPLEIWVPRGTDLHVQLECGAPSRAGRLHTIAVDSGEKLIVDTAFDEAVQPSSNGLGLSYERLDDLIVRSHLLKVAHVLGATAAISVSQDSAGEFVLRLVGDREGRAVTTDATTQGLESGIERLLTPPSKEQPAVDDDDAVLLEEPFDYEEAARSTRRWRTMLGLGASLSALGVGAFVVAGVKYPKWRDEGTVLRLSPATTPEASRAHQQAQKSWVNDRAHVVYGAIGAGVGALGMGLLAEAAPLRMKRWLAPVSATVGLGLVAVGSSQLLQSSSCEMPVERARLAHCIDQRSMRDRGVIWTLGAMPFLTFPLVELANWAFGSRVSSSSHPKVHASTSELRLTWAY